MESILNANSILIIQPENPDGDSLASALALDQIFYDLGKKSELFCPVNIPRHLAHIEGWDRVKQEVENIFDVSIIVDTSADTLLEKVQSHTAWPQILKKPIVVIDHHDHDPDLSFDFINLSNRRAAATSEVIYDLAREHDLPISERAAKYMAISIMSDTLGLNSVATTSKVVRIIADLIDKGVNLSDLEAKRRESMIRPQEITLYKGKLLQRVEFLCEGKLALVVIPWEEIEAYSDKYNPSVLVIEDMRLTEGVELAVALKVYNDGKITGKLRANNEYSHSAKIAQEFGGGGHPYAAGFKIENVKLEEIKEQLISKFESLSNENI